MTFNKQQFIEEKKKDFKEMIHPEPEEIRWYFSLESLFEQSLNEAITKAVENCIELSEEIQFEEETNLEEWKAFKRFRNTLRGELLK